MFGLVFIVVKDQRLLRICIQFLGGLGDISSLDIFILFFNVFWNLDSIWLWKRFSSYLGNGVQWMVSCVLLNVGMVGWLRRLGFGFLLGQFLREFFIFYFGILLCLVWNRMNTLVLVLAYLLIRCFWYFRFWLSFNQIQQI